MHPVPVSQRVEKYLFAICCPLLLFGVVLLLNDWFLQSSQLGNNSKPSPAVERRARLWELRESEPVASWIDNSIRYQLTNAESAEEYSRLVPSGCTVSLPTDMDMKGPGPRPQEVTYTVAMFHQLKCLDIIRNDYANKQASMLSQHCLNYLRQSILCLADTRLEPVRAGKPPNVVTLEGDYICKDWTVLYDAVKNVH